MSYPAVITVETPPEMDNWRAIGQWILAIPHLIIVSALESASGALAVVSWFMILFTGSLPEGLANLQIMILRYSTRVQLYAGFLHDQYPPFDFALSPYEPGGTPVGIEIVPELEDRDRLTVGLRILWAIPALLYVMVIGLVGAVCWFIAIFAVLFTGSWPEGLRAWVMKLTRVSLRFQAYALLLTDQYPPYESN